MPMLNKKQLTLSILPDCLAICRMASDQPIPAWAYKDAFFTISRTPDELSIVCSENSVPAGVKAEKGWRSFKVEGPLDFSLTGVLAALARPLADAKISIFAISTFDTDYILVKQEYLEQATKVLSAHCNIQV